MQRTLTVSPEITLLDIAPVVEEEPLRLRLLVFVKPLSFARLFFTYIIPINLITVTYDGIVSVLKSKTVRHYETLLKNSSTQTFTITVNSIKNWKGNVVYIKGQPINI